MFHLYLSVFICIYLYLFIFTRLNPCCVAFLDFHIMRNVSKKLKQFLFFLTIVFVVFAPALAQRQNNRNRNAPATPSPYASTSPQNFALSQEPNQLNTFLKWSVGFLVLATVIVGLIAYTKSKQHKRKLKEQKWQELCDNLKAIDSFYCGVYAGGLYSSVSGRFSTHCLITAKEFIFVADSTYTVIGSIARNRIAQISVQDKSYTVDRASVWAILFLGIFGLFFRNRKKQEQYSLVIEWEDERRVRQNVLFDFGSKGSATRLNNASNYFQEYALTRA